MIISPKSQFLATLSPQSNFRGLIRSNDVQNALTCALAEVALTNPTAEEIRGATKFINTFLNIAEEAKPIGGVPDKRLDYSVLDSSPKPPKPSEPPKPPDKS